MGEKLGGSGGSSGIERRDLTGDDDPQPDFVTITPVRFNQAPFQVTPDELVGLITEMYEHGRKARAAGHGALWGMCFHEVYGIVDAHLPVLDEDQVERLKRGLHEVGYYEELNDPYGLGPITNQEV